MTCVERFYESEGLSRTLFLGKVISATVSCLVSLKIFKEKYCSIPESHSMKASGMSLMPQCRRFLILIKV